MRTIYSDAHRRADAVRLRGGYAVDDIGVNAVNVLSGFDDAN